LKLPLAGSVFISIKNADKDDAIAPARALIDMGFQILATRGTAKALEAAGLAVKQINKVLEGRPHVVDAMKNGGVQIVFNTTEGKQSLEDSFPQAGQGSLRALAGCFGFSGDDVEKRCRVLSGGEKARLVMAIMLYDPPNFLVLDEPTNHLDLMTKEMLIAALSQYEGAMLFVSHDRRFLAALSNRVLELTPDGVQRYDGGYSEYVARTGHEAPGLHS